MRQAKEKGDDPMSRMPLPDARHAPVPVTRADPHGAVIPAGDVDEVLRLPMQRRAGHQARIELHHDRARDLWMWAIWYDIEERGGGHRVGPKWGKFARTRADALHCAITELLERIAGCDTAQARRIRTWAEGLAEGLR